MKGINIVVLLLVVIAAFWMFSGPQSGGSFADYPEVFQSGLAENKRFARRFNTMPHPSPVNHTFRP